MTPEDEWTDIRKELRTLLDTLVSLARENCTTGPTSIHSLRFATLHGLLFKARDTRIAIQMLSDKGLEPEAEALLRVLLETVVHLGLLEKDNDVKLTYRFYFHSLRKLQKMGKASHLRDSVTEHLVKKMERQALEVFEKPEWKKIRGLDGWFPSRKDKDKSASIEEMMSICGYGDMYAVVYTSASAVIHGFDVTNYAKLEEMEDGGIRMVVPKRNYGEGNKRFADMLFFDALAGFAGAFSFSRLKDLQNLRSRIDQLKSALSNG